MSTPELDPEEVQRQLLASIQSMADAMASMGVQVSRQADMTKTHFEAEDARLAEAKKQADERKALEGDRIKEEALKTGRLKTSNVEEAKHNRELSKHFRNRLGVEEEINPMLKKVLENRSTIEQRLVDAAKRQYGDEVFNLSQRNKFFREQLQQYSAGNLAHGGVVTQFKDLSKQQQDAIVDAAKTQKKLQLEQANFTKTVQHLANPGAAVGDMKGKFSTLGGAVDTGKESLIKMAGGGSLALHSFEILFGVGKVLGAALEGAAKAALGMTKSLLNGERGMAVGAKANETFVKSITGAVGALGKVVMAAGAILALFGPFTFGLSAAAGAAIFATGAAMTLGAAAAETAAELNTFAAELNDKLYKGFAELGKLSMTGARGMTGVIDSLHKMGLTASEFDKLNKVISANAKEMKMFGVTAEQGVNKFAETAGELYKSEMGRTFELMAISAEDQYEHTAKFLALQARLGLTQEKNSKQEQAALGAYIVELDKIATLTGASRKEQEDARNAVMAIEQLRAGLLVEQKNAELTGDYSRVEEIKRAIEVATTLQAKGMVREATGVAKLTATNGVVTDATGSEVLQMMGGPGGSLESIKKGTGTAESRSLDALNSVIKQATRAAEMGGMYGAPMEGLFGGSYAAAGNVSADLMELNKSEAAEKSKLKDKYNRQEHLDRITSTRVAKDPTTIQNVDNNRLLMKNAVIMDKVAFALNEMLLNDINSKPAKIFDSAVDKFAEAVGYKGGKTEKPATSQAGRDAQAHRSDAGPLHDRAAALDRTIEADEKALKEAIRAGQTEEERKPLVERINKATAERAKVVEEILAQEKKARDAELKARELRQQQAKDRAELARLQTANERDTSKLGDLNEKRDLLLRREQSTGEVDKEISEVKTDIAGRSEKINVGKSKLYSGEKTDVGEIGSFTKEQSKSYANAVAKKESGGDIGVENTLGYLGKYQFGAEALASVGILDAQKYAKLKSQHMRNKEILNDSSVWAIPGGKEAFLKDEKLQDATFNKYTTMNLAGLQANNVVNKSTTTEDTAGWLMAAHLKGVGGATKLSKGEDNADAYGTRASTYFAAGKQSLGQTLAAAPVTPTQTVAAPVTLAANTEQAHIEPDFKTTNQEEIDKTKAGRDNWFAKPKVPPVTPRPVAKAEPLPDPVTDPKGYKAAVNARIMQKVSFDPVKTTSVEEKTPQAKFGGLFNGPLSGYPVTLHGRETVTPMPNPNSLVASNEASMVQKDPLPTTAPAAPAANADSGALLELFKMLSDKMDTLSDHMASGNDTREELLKYSRV